MCPFETAIPEGNTAVETGGTQHSPPQTTVPDGLFRQVPEDSVEPFNAYLFWRRPESPPPVAAQSKIALAAALHRAGWNPREFAVSYWETKGEWPGGMMVVPQLTVVAPNGVKVDLSPELIVRTPDAAVDDIRRALAAPAQEEAAAET